MPRPVIVKILGMKVTQSSFINDPDAAHLDDPNVFTDVNTFPGLRIGTRTVTEDYELTVIDFELLVDATAGPITITLPMALGSGQIYHVKKIDDTANAVTVVSQVGDLIDGETDFALEIQYADIALVDGELAYWDRWGTGASFDLADVARLSIPNTFTDLNTFTGVRFATRTVIDDYELTPLDFTVLVDASAGPVTLTLPPAAGNGQLYHIKKIDDTDEVVTIVRSGTDLIDDSISVNFVTQWGSALLHDAAIGYWDNIGSEIDISVASSDLAELSVQVASADAALSVRIDGLSVGGGAGSMTSNEISALVQVASAAATSANAHANTVSSRAVSISNELGSLLASTSAALEAHINVVSAAGVTGGASVTSQELSVLVQTASAAATLADAHAATASAAATSIGTKLFSTEVHVDGVSARAVSISNELGSLLASTSAALETHANTASAAATSADAHANTASAAATSADAHANAVSARVVSVSNELGSLLASASLALETHINLVSAAGVTGGASVTSQEVSVLVQTASAAATSADAHANTVSARVVSASAELASLIQIASAAATSADTHAATASAAATSADVHANTVSARAVSISNELGSLLASASLALETHANTASAAATSADAHANTVSQRAVSISNELGSLMASLSANLISKIGVVSLSANAISARVVSVSNELGSLLASASAALETHVNTASAAATSADAHANTVSARVVSVSAELVSLFTSVDNKLSASIQVASAAATSADAHAATASAAATSADAHAATASAAATSADAHANTVSVRAVSISNELGSLLASASLALETHINAVSAAGVTGGASVTSTELSAAFNASTATSSPALSNAISNDHSVSAVIKLDIASVSAVLETHINTVSANATAVYPGVAQPYVYDSSTSDSDPGSGRLRFNTSDPTFADDIFIDNNNANGSDVTSMLDAFGSVGTPYFNTITITKKSDPSVFASYRLTSLAIDGTGYRKFQAINRKANNGSFANNDPIIVDFLIDNDFSSQIDTTSQALVSLVQIVSVAAVSVDAHANTVSARVVSVSAELVSLINSAATAVSAQAASTNNVISARVVSVSNELGSLLASASAALETHIVAASAAATSIGTKLTSVEAHVDVVSARAVSISAEVVSLLNSADAALSLRITSVGGLGAGSVTSTELSAMVQGYSTTATAAGTTALSANSPPEEFFTGVTTQTVTLPDVTTLVLGKQYAVYNNSTGAVTVQSSGANTIVAMVAGSRAVFTCIAITGTGTASWSYAYSNTAADVVSARVVSVSAELASLINVSVSVLSNRVTSVSAELASLLLSAAPRKAVNTGVQASITVSAGSTVSGVSLALSAGVTYTFDFQIPFTARVTTGVVVAVLGPATNQYVARYEIPGAVGTTGVAPAANAVTPFFAQVRAINTKVSTTSITLTGTTLMAYAQGIINPSAGGSLKFLIGINDAAGGTNNGIVVLQGANVRVWRMLN